MKNFQTIVIFVFAVFALIGVIFFATQRPNSGEDVIQISVWGTVDDEIFNKISNEISQNELNAFEIKYKQIKEDNFYNELIEALAIDTGPDAILISQDNILRYENKIFNVPFSSFSERDFRDNFVEGAEIFLTEEGIVAFPLTIDPIVMYWNRDILSNAGIVKPPIYWDEIYLMVKKITEKDNTQNLKKETIAFGEFDNIKNAKEIISALILQSGNSITSREVKGLKSVLNLKGEGVIPATESAIRFYTEFSNPSKEMYTWNRSKNNSLEEFLAGNLAFYIGFSGELKEIREKNPNLNFDVAKLPQIRDSKIDKTFADITGLAILKSSTDSSSVIKVISYLISDDSLLLFSKYFNLPPIKRELLTQKQSDVYKEVFYNSAIIGRAWLDPNAQETETIFKNMIENVTSGKYRISESINRASVGIQNLVK